MLSLLKEGFLGTAAPLYADLTLLLETVMGFALIVGVLLARQRRFLLHAWCQSTVIFLNAAIIVLAMLPSFILHVSPRIPAKLGKLYYALATAHAALGIIAEIGGLYILLAAGTTILPQRFRLTEYRLWMRAELVLWWLVLLLGMMTYTWWYVPHVGRYRGTTPVSRNWVNERDGDGTPATNSSRFPTPACKPRHRC